MLASVGPAVVASSFEAVQFVRPLRDRFEESDAFRRGVLGAISGALAGVVLTLLGQQQRRRSRERGPPQASRGGRSRRASRCRHDSSPSPRERHIAGRALSGPNVASPPWRIMLPGMLSTRTDSVAAGSSADTSIATTGLSARRRQSCRVVAVHHRRIAIRWMCGNAERAALTAGDPPAVVARLRVDDCRRFGDCSDAAVHNRENATDPLSEKLRAVSGKCEVPRDLQILDEWFGGERRVRWRRGRGRPVGVG